MNQANRNKLALVLAAASLVVMYLSARAVECAPTPNNANASHKSANRLIKPGLLGNLFRRHTPASGSAGAGSGSASSEPADSEEPATQTELDAQKFMDSLPNAGASGGPTTFRERVSDTFGVLREGVSNQFRALRDNWSDTVEDLRDTWTGSD